MNITFSIVTVGLVFAIILVFAIYAKLKIVKFIAKIVVIACVIGALFFYLRSINFDPIKLVIM